MPRAEYIKFELDSYEPLKTHFGDEYIVLPQGCPSGPSHHHHYPGLFPSFLLDYEHGFFKNIYDRARNERLYAISPDYVIIKKDNVTHENGIIRSINKESGVIDINEMDKIIQKNISECIGNDRMRRPCYWLFSEVMRDAFNEYLLGSWPDTSSEKKKEGKYIAMFLKEGCATDAVIDCKFYKNKIPASEINKLKRDAALCAAEECYILTNAEKNYSGERNVKFPSHDKYLIKVNDYEQPKPISKNEFWSKYDQDVKQFCK